jgi:hypothetical protein
MLTVGITILSVTWGPPRALFSPAAAEEWRYEYTSDEIVA